MRGGTHARLSLVALLAATGVARVVTSCAESAPLAEGPPDADDRAESGTVLPPADSCGEGTWCRIELPSAPVALNGIWGSGPEDVWVAGSPHITIHWDGKRFVRTTVDTRQALYGVWGSGKGDIWTFSTSRTMWHSQGFDGEDAGWSRSAETTDLNDGGLPTPILAMWGTSASDVWAVGAGTLGIYGDQVLPSVLHCDGWRDGEPNWQPSGTSFGDAPSPEPFSFNAIHGNASSGVWIVGNGGKTRYSAGWNSDRAEWTPVNSNTSRNLNAVWCSPDADVWAAGEGGSMHRFTRAAGGEYAELTVEVPTTAALRALWGFAADDVWAVGDAGTILHWDGKAWIAEASIQGLTDDLFAIWGSSKDDIWIAGRNVLLHNGTASLPREIQ
jgi:photosystem II stability/assembly factor-like uncharacterized protein